MNSAAPGAAAAPAASPRGRRSRRMNYGLLVPKKSPNEAGYAAEEAMEGRGRAKGNAGQTDARRTQGRERANHGLERVRQPAKRNRKQRFTALLHHVYAIECLRVAEVLNAIYETDFLGFSYGFRPGRSPHHALDALTVGICDRRVNWVLDADIRSFFDTMTHEWLVRFVEHRVGDKRVVRLIQQWLTAGVLEDGVRIASEEGAVQGGSISPLLANLYLHYVFDLWVQRWRRKEA